MYHNEETESFKNLPEFLNPGKDSCKLGFLILQADYHKVVMTLEVQSQL